MTDLLVGVDPHKERSVLAALFSGRVRAVRVARGDVGRAPDVLGEVLEDLGALGRGGRLVVEVPQIYERHKGRQRYEDQVQVALVSGAWLREATRLGLDARGIKPARWKGQVDKEVTRHRVRRDLDADELAIVELAVAETRGAWEWDVWDATAIALSRVGRYR